jgi:hypothetical protein
VLTAEAGTVPAAAAGAARTAVAGTMASATASVIITFNRRSLGRVINA